MDEPCPDILFIFLLCILHNDLWRTGSNFKFIFILIRKLDNLTNMISAIFYLTIILLFIIIYFM